jgi:hypothetical protein
VDIRGLVKSRVASSLCGVACIAHASCPPVAAVEGDALESAPQLRDRLKDKTRRAQEPPDYAIVFASLREKIKARSVVDLHRYLEFVHA